MSFYLYPTLNKNVVVAALKKDGQLSNVFYPLNFISKRTMSYGFSGILAERLPTLADPAVRSTFEYLV
jgi:hypothetical protein